MKRWIVVILAGSMILGCAACTGSQTVERENSGSEIVSESGTESGEKDSQIDANEPDENVSESGTEPEFVRMAKIDDYVYTDTGEISRVLRCGVLDFSFDSSVEEGEPTENNQTNFGSGYGGQYGMRENRIEILIDGDWHVFAYQENDLEDVALSVGKVTNHSIEWTIQNDSAQTLTTSPDCSLEVWDEELLTWSYVIEYAKVCVEDMAFTIQPGKQQTWSVDWRQRYGELEAGTYRLIKEVCVDRVDGKDFTHTLTVEFEISPVG